MAIPVSDENVDQPDAQIITSINALVASLLETLEQADRLLDLRYPRDAVFDPFLDPAEDPRELLSELAEPGMVRHHCELRSCVEDASRGEQRRHDQRSAGMRSADEILR